RHLALGGARGCDGRGARRGARGGPPSHEDEPRRRARSQERPPPPRARLPALRNADSLVAAGRRRAHGVLVPAVSTRKGTAHEVEGRMPVRAPHLYNALRCFSLGAFRMLLSELDDGGELPFAFEEHVTRGRPAFYEYRPLVRTFVEVRAHRLRARDDAGIAIDELRREPAAAIFARAHAGPRRTEDDALFASVLLPLLVRIAESCGGFDWDDAAFDKAYADLETSLF